MFCYICNKWWFRETVFKYKLVLGKKLNLKNLSAETMLCLMEKWSAWKVITLYLVQDKPVFRFENNKCADQPAHPLSLISAFFLFNPCKVSCQTLNKQIFNLPTSFLAEQADFATILLKILTTGFLKSRPILPCCYRSYHGNYYLSRWFWPLVLEYYILFICRFTYVAQKQPKVMHSCLAGFTWEMEMYLISPFS